MLWYSNVCCLVFTYFWRFCVSADAPVRVRRRQMLLRLITCHECYHPQSNYRDNGLWRQVTQNSTTQTLIFNDILFSSPGDGMLEQRLWLSGELRRGITSSNDIQNLNDDIKTSKHVHVYRNTMGVMGQPWYSQSPKYMLLFVASLSLEYKNRMYKKPS